LSAKGPESNPLVSVVIPTYNSEFFLAATINSACRQTYANLEILVIDDCSTDGTAGLVEKLSTEDPRIKYFRTNSQSNLPSVPRNIGISHSMGECIAFLDHDDLWRKRKIELQMTEFMIDKDLTMLFSPLWQFSGRNYLWGFILLRPPVGVISKRKLMENNPLQCSSVLIRRHALVSQGGFNEAPELRAVEDYDLWIRIQRVFKVKELYKILGFYRHVRSSTSQNENMNKRLEFLKIIHPELLIPETQSMLQRISFRLKKIPVIIFKIRF